MKPALPPAHSGHTRVVVFNSYVGNNRPRSLVRWLRSTDYDLALVNELNKRVQRVLARRAHVFNDPEDRYTRENAVVLPGHSPVEVAHRTVLLTRSQGTPVAPARYASVVASRAAHLTAISFHANAVIQGHEGRWAPNAGAKAWRQDGLPRLASLIDSARGFGDKVIVGGDANAAAGKAHDDTDPGEFFHSCGLNALSEGYMWCAWSREFQLVRKHVLPTPPGSDAHKVLVVDLAPRLN